MDERKVRFHSHLHVIIGQDDIQHQAQMLADKLWAATERSYIAILNDNIERFVVKKTGKVAYGGMSVVGKEQLYTHLLECMARNSGCYAVFREPNKN